MIHNTGSAQEMVDYSRDYLEDQDEIKNTTQTKEFEINGLLGCLLFCFIGSAFVSIFFFGFTAMLVIAIVLSTIAFVGFLIKSVRRIFQKR